MHSSIRAIARAHFLSPRRGNSRETGGFDLEEI
jgi:hypothetical protein